MALIHMEGFETFLPSEISLWRGTGSSTSVGTTLVPGRYGGLAYKEGGQNKGISFAMGARPDVTTGFAWHPAAHNRNDLDIINFNDDIDGQVNAARRVSLRCNINGTEKNLSLHHGAPGVRLLTGVNILIPEQWYYVEMRVFRNGGASEIQVWLDSRLYLSYTGTLTGADTTRLFLGDQNGDGLNSATTLYDDFYSLDPTGARNNNRLGECYIETLDASGAGVGNGFIGIGAGTLAATVSDYPHDGLTTYAEGVNSADRLSLSFNGQLLEDPAAIHGLELTSLAQKDYESSRSVFGFCAAADAQETVLTAERLNAGAWAPLRHFYETVPGTSTAWTQASLHAASFGLEIA